MSISIPIAETVDSPTIRNAKRGQWLTVGHGLLEGSGALWAARGAASVALLSFGLDSFIEVLSAGIVLWRLASIGQTHRLVLSERAGLRLVGVCFLALSVDIAYESIKAVIGREGPHETALGILVAALSIVLMPVLGRAKRKWADEVGSAALWADARQTDFCAYLAGITLLGLVLNTLFHWWWADPVAALVMAPMIAWEGVQALRGHACGCCACSV